MLGGRGKTKQFQESQGIRHKGSAKKNIRIGIKNLRTGPRNPLTYQQGRMGGAPPLDFEKNASVYQYKSKHNNKTAVNIINILIIVIPDSS